MKITIAIVAAAVICFVAPAPPALAEECGDGSRCHEGFSMRLSGGGGYSEASSEGLEISGWGGLGGVCLAAAATPYLVFTVGYMTMRFAHPQVTLLESTVTSTATVSYNGVGPGLTWYLLPYNYYISAMVTAAWADSGNADRYETDAGAGLILQFGREWWLSDSWAVGLGGWFAAMLVSDGQSDLTDSRGRDEEINVFAGGLQGSVSFD